jgi:hypothetical protein
MPATFVRDYVNSAYVDVSRIITIPDQKPEGLRSGIRYNGNLCINISWFENGACRVIAQMAEVSISFHINDI